MEDNTYYSKRAKEFLGEYNISKVSLDDIYKIIESQGYRIVRYNTFDENPAAEQLLKELNLKHYSEINTAFTYKDGSIKVVFLDDYRDQNLSRARITATAEACTIMK